MLFCLFEGSFLISILTGGASWIFLGYQFGFAVITFSGIVMVYKEADPVRTALAGLKKLRPATLPA
jgi:steroid 5-alpha reductase family enzyme